MKTRALVFLSCLIMLVPMYARDFHIDSINGDDANSGESASKAWKTLSKANAQDFEPGDTLKLKRGAQFMGGLSLELNGTAEEPIVIGAYGEGPLPVINAKGYRAGVHLPNSHHVVVRDLEITADGGKTVDGSNPGFRYGVHVQAVGKGTASHVSIENLVLHKIYPELAEKHEGKNATTFLGTGVAIEGMESGISEHFKVSGCTISDVGFKAVSLNRVRNVEVLDNRMTDIGGPAIQPGRVEDLVVRGNVVTSSGSSLDPRMHARGSGIWPWTCKRVLMEKTPSCTHAVRVTPAASTSISTAAMSSCNTT